MPSTSFDQTTVRMDPVYVYRATATKVYDGDTFTALVDLGFRVSCTISVRVLGVDTPEMKDPDPEKRAAAKKAQQFTEGLLLGKQFLIESYKDRESFARWVCAVWIDGSRLDDMLIDAGLGVYMMR